MATTTKHHTSGILPTTNDLVAVAVLAITDLIRLATLSPEYVAPYYLTLTTDLILPIMAGAWFWIVAMYTVIKRHG